MAWAVCNYGIYRERKGEKVEGERDAMKVSQCACLHNIQEVVQCQVLPSKPFSSSNSVKMPKYILSSKEIPEETGASIRSAPGGRLVSRRPLLYLLLNVSTKPSRMITNMSIPATTPAILTVLSTCFSGSTAFEFWVDAPAGGGGRGIVGSTDTSQRGGGALLQAATAH